MDEDLEPLPNLKGWVGCKTGVLPKQNKAHAGEFGGLVEPQDRSHAGPLEEMEWARGGNSALLPISWGHLLACVHSFLWLLHSFLPLCFSGYARAVPHWLYMASALGTLELTAEFLCPISKYWREHKIGSSWLRGAHAVHTAAMRGTGSTYLLFSWIGQWEMTRWKAYKWAGKWIDSLAV